MAVLTFTQRYNTDTRFKTRVDGLLMESIYAMAGIDAQDLCRRWEAGDHELKLEDVAAPEPTPEAAEAPPPEVLEQVQFPENPPEGVKAKTPRQSKTTTRRSTK